MLHFDANPITIGYPVTRYEGLDNANKNNMKEFEHRFG